MNSCILSRVCACTIMCVCDMLWSHAAHALHSAPCCVADQKSLRWHAQIMRHSRPSQAAIPMHGVQRAYCLKIDDSVWHVRAGPSRGCRGARAARARLEHRLYSRLSKEVAHECLTSTVGAKAPATQSFTQGKKNTRVKLAPRCAGNAGSWRRPMRDGAEGATNGPSDRPGVDLRHVSQLL